MHLETYPITVNAGQQWINFNNLAYESIRKSNLTFLYIGKDEESLQYFSTYFRSGIFAEGFVQAQLIIDSFHVNNDPLPDAIIIDIPLNKLHLENFCSFLKEKSLLSRTPLIYNEKQLDEDKVKFLHRFELIDDVININSWEINYSTKISFLKKVKNQQRVVHVSNKSVNISIPPPAKKVTGMKRMFDILVSSIAIAIASPVLILVAIAIKLESKGPVLYTSSRAGRGFRIFKFYKFRTMEVDADQKIDALAHLNQYKKNETGAKFLKLCNDPRVTKVGKFLRNTSLDELPQLFNVLKGDMSLVGNRPLPIYEATTLTTNEFVERFMAPAGMTGLWQVKKRGKADMSVEERISLDISYARKSNMLYDMWIIAQTPAALFQKTNV